MSGDSFDVSMQILGRRRRVLVENKYHGLQDLTLKGDKVTTLSRNGVNPRGVIGVLYVPDLEQNSSCYNQSQKYIPDDVVRHGTIGDIRWFPLYMAIAPWISEECTKQYLETARFPGDDFRGMIFYVPDNSTERPPDTSSPQWNLNDGESWKSQYNFPVYAVPGATGQAVVNKLSQFSDMSTSPAAKSIFDYYVGYTPSAFKVIGTVGTDQQSGNPSLWLFLLIVIAALGGGLIITSIFMHWRARRRRERLRRMIINGEISLDLLGVKKVTVPRDDIDKMPLYIYNTPNTLNTQPSPPAIITSPPKAYDPGAISEKSATTTIATEVPNSKETASVIEDEEHQVVSNPNNNPIVPKTYDSEAQPSCPICLDDYICGRTIVRALPCDHIYHPECIDKFLSRNSSMCPMCKKSALPAGYCPPLITSTMVRRERDMRMRADLQVLESSQGVFLKDLRLWWLRKRLSRNGQSLRSGSIELAMRRAMVRESVARRNETRASLQRMTRSQRAEVRGRELAGENEVTGEAVEERPRPAWRRALRKVFPSTGA